MVQIEFHMSDGGEITVNEIASLAVNFHMCNANFESTGNGKFSKLNSVWNINRIKDHSSGDRMIWNTSKSIQSDKHRTEHIHNIVSQFAT